MFDWKDPLKHASLWLSGVATAALTFFFMFPGEALTVWNAMPAEVKALLPEATGVQISLGLLVASIIAKWVPQATVAAWVRKRLAAATAWLSLLLKSGGGAVQPKHALTGAGAALLLLVGPVAYTQLHKDVPAHEGGVNKGYLDPVGIPTKCAGDTTDVEVGRVYTDEECRVSLDTQLLAHAQPVLDFAPGLKDHPYILVSAIDFTYNIGASGFRNGPVGQNLRAGHYAAGCKAMNESPTGRPQYIFAGKVLICRKQPVKGPPAPFCLYKGQMIDGHLCAFRGQTFLAPRTATKQVCDMQPQALMGLVKRRAENRALCERGL